MNMKNSVMIQNDTLRNGKKRKLSVPMQKYILKNELSSILELSHDYSKSNESLYLKRVLGSNPHK